MTRLGFFFFHILLVTVIYGEVYLNGSKPATVSYVLGNFSGPYFIIILLMTLLTTIRWFMSHDLEVGREIVTWLNALWFVPAITLGALYLTGGIEHHFWYSLRGLMKLR